MTEMTATTHNALTGSVINTAEATASTTASEDAITLAISLPIAGHTLRSATNLFNLICTWGALISSATGGKFKVDKYFINVINRREFESVEELLAYARTETEIHRVLAGLKIGHDKITFYGFKEIAALENCKLHIEVIQGCLPVTHRHRPLLARGDYCHPYCFRCSSYACPMFNEELYIKKTKRAFRIFSNAVKVCSMP